ncbi:atypical chemokine receptor 4b isoform X1 [Danio rerio]|uniref:Atypical chemokine receptor 4b isoform X1 n=1 Tax=Danio rerio TaxID=7955 RepID=A0AC58IQZ9_DANRE|nr:uncharacterized protein ackr4b isoform X2 [Danio rerio]XP_021329418.1 uncharacterized protein ackr4b isoform X2 [Danio rerio]|eukprot:XP_017209465.1 uncharacterized protein ackr4b isoform X2 [Danio rerio]
MSSCPSGNNQQSASLLWTADSSFLNGVSHHKQITMGVLLEYEHDYQYHDHDNDSNDSAYDEDYFGDLHTVCDKQELSCDFPARRPWLETNNLPRRTR